MKLQHQVQLPVSVWVQTQMILNKHALTDRNKSLKTNWKVSLPFNIAWMSSGKWVRRITNLLSGLSRSALKIFL